MSNERGVVRWGHRVFLGTLVGLFAAAACGQSNESGGGSGGAGSGGTSASGGTSSGGSVGSGGKAGSGGVGSGGATATGGSSSGGAVGSGGSTTSPSGGKTGSGGAASGGDSGSGGAGPGGSTGKQDGSVEGTGGGGTSVAGTGGVRAGTGGGSSQGGGTGGGGEPGSCAGHVLSLSANKTGTENDSAYSHVEIDLKTDAPTGNAKRTIEFWAFIKTTDWVGENNQVYFSGDGSGSNTSFGLDFGTNAVTGSSSNHATLNPFTGSDIRDDSGKDLGINSSKDQWVHIAMTWDGTAFVTFVNGAAKITVQAGGKTLNTKGTSLMIGCNPTNKNCFSGYFDEFRVWNVARSASEIKESYDKPLAGDEAGLVGYWKFDEDSGTTTADAVTAAGHTKHDGTLMADTAAHNPTFVTPKDPVPLVCP